MVRMYIAMKVALLISAGATAVAQERKPDTVITVRVPERTIQVPVPIRYIEVLKHDTVYVCPPTIVPMKWSEYKGSFQQYLNDAVVANKVAFVDKAVIPAATIEVPSGLKMLADTGIVIYNKVGVLFRLHKATGSQYFEGLRILQDSGGVAFDRITLGVSFYDSLQNVQVRGGDYAYNSSRGGTANKMAVTAMRNCFFDVRMIALSVFSQEGPFRALHLYNVQMKTSVTHNIYVHPATSLYYDSVATLGAGKLMQHQYSGSGNGGYETGKYSVFKRVYTKDKAFEMTTLAGMAPVLIYDSQIAPYVTKDVPPAHVYATGTRFTNAGNGIFLRGKIERCTGGAWSSDGDTLRIVNSQLDELCFRGGGVYIVSESTIGFMWGADRVSKASATIQLRNSTVGTYWGEGMIPVIIQLQGSKVGRYTGKVGPEVIL